MAINNHSVLVDLYENGIGKVFLDGIDISNHVLNVKIESEPGKETRVTFSTRPEKVSAHFQNAEVYLVEKEWEELGQNVKNKRNNILYVVFGAVLAFSYVGLVGTFALFFF